MKNEIAELRSELESKNKQITLLYEEKDELAKCLARQKEHIKKMCHAAGHQLVSSFEMMSCKTCNQFIGWQCVTSPIKVCQYDMEIDPSCDSCIWCMNPEERK